MHFVVLSMEGIQRIKRNGMRHWLTLVIISIFQTQLPVCKVHTIGSEESVRLEEAPHLYKVAKTSDWWNISPQCHDGCLFIYLLHNLKCMGVPVHVRSASMLISFFDHHSVCSTVPSWLINKFFLCIIFSLSTFFSLSHVLVCFFGLPLPFTLC